MTLSDVLKATPRGMLIAVVLAFILLNGLGIWQLERLHWKEGLIRDMARTEAAAPLPAEALVAQAKPEWRKASLPPCDISNDRLIHMHSEAAGVPGYRVLTACPLADGALLVDLGFVTEKLHLAAPLTLTPVGRLRPFETPGRFTLLNRVAQNDWYWRSASEMGTVLKTPVRDNVFLVLDLQASHADIPGLRQGLLTAPLPNRHLEYALTWFGLAWVLLGVFGSVVYQRLQRPKPEKDT